MSEPPRYESHTPDQRQSPQKVGSWAEEGMRCYGRQSTVRDRRSHALISRHSFRLSCGRASTAPANTFQLGNLFVSRLATVRASNQCARGHGNVDGRHSCCDLWVVRASTVCSLPAGTDGSHRRRTRDARELGPDAEFQQFDEFPSSAKLCDR